MKCSIIFTINICTSSKNKEYFHLFYDLLILTVGINIIKKIILHFTDWKTSKRELTYLLFEEWRRGEKGLNFKYIKSFQNPNWYLNFDRGLVYLEQKVIELIVFVVLGFYL